LRALAWIALSLLSLCFSAPAAAGDARVKLTTLEWPPYAGAGLPSGGASVAAARAAFAAVGWTLEVEYLPWKRAVERARAGTDGVVGYFPEYYDPAMEGILFSAPMGVSQVGFAEPTARRFSWNTLADLAALGPIGVVDGYANSPEFDAAVRVGALKVAVVSEDLLNLRKVASGRIRAAVIDRLVMAHLARSDPTLAAAKTQIGFNAKLLIEQRLFVAFRKSPDGLAARTAFDQGLALLGDVEIAKPYRSVEDRGIARY